MRFYGQLDVKMHIAMMTSLIACLVRARRYD